MDFTSSTSSGRFVFDRKNGFSSCGSYGKVYKGIDKETKEFVAIKVLKKKEVSADEDLERIQCPNVVKFVAKDTFVKQYAKTAKKTTIAPKKEMDVVVMEYCNGDTLEDFVKSNLMYHNGLPDHLFLLVLECLVNTLEALHNAKMIHRDITKYNIMSHTKMDGEILFKVIDFGFTKMLTHDDEKVTSLCGAPEFLPMESFYEWVLKGKTDSLAVSYSYDVDFWMVGVTLFFAATGKYPFQPWGYINWSESDGIQECHKVWGEMMKQKRDENIWINQEVENGPFLQYEDMPDDCNLSPGLRMLVAPIFKGLLSKRAKKHEKYPLKSFIEDARSILNMCCMNLYHLPSMKIEKMYMSELKWSEVFLTYGALQPNEKEQLSEDFTKNLFVYRGQVMNLDRKLNHVLPVYPAMQRCVIPTADPPTIIFTPLNFNTRALRVTESVRSKYDIPSSLESDDAWASTGILLCQLYQYAAKEKEILLMDDLVMALREKCKMQWEYSLNTINKFCDSITIMTKMCTSYPSGDWTKLIQASIDLMRLSEKTQASLNGIFNKWSIPSNLFPKRQQSILCLLHTYNTVYQRNYGVEGIHETERMADNETCIECVRKAVVFCEEIEKDIKKQRAVLETSMKRTMEVLAKFGSTFAYVATQEELKKNVIQVHSNNRKNGEGDAVRCLAGLFDVMRGSEQFKLELNELENTLKTVQNEEVI